MSDCQKQERSALLPMNKRYPIDEAATAGWLKRSQLLKRVFKGNAHRRCGSMILGPKPQAKLGRGMVSGFF